MARQDEMSGLAVEQEQQLDAYLLYFSYRSEAQVVSQHDLVDDDGARLKQLVSRLRSQFSACSFSKAHLSEIPRARLTGLGFRPTHTHCLYSTTARSA